jgi:uncharacterized protein YjbJ (UPF0337 family)
MAGTWLVREVDGEEFAPQVRRRDVMNKDQVEGQFDQVKGKMKQGIGKATGDPALHDEGVADELAGDVQEGVGKAKEKVGNAIKDLGDRIKH